MTPEDKANLRQELLVELIKEGVAKKTGKRSFFMGKRIDWELPKHLGSHLPRPSDFRTEPKDKQARYTRKLRLAGRCPACGKPCAPYRSCEEHRFKKQLGHVLSTLVVEGKIVRLSRGLYDSAPKV